MRSLTGKVVSAIFFGEEFSCKKIENESITGNKIYILILYIIKNVKLETYNRCYL